VNVQHFRGYLAAANDEPCEVITAAVLREREKVFDRGPAPVTKQPVYAGALDLCRRLGLEVPWLPSAGGQRWRQPPSRSPPWC